MPPKKVAVIGGGISGLLSAHELHKAGIRVSLFEASPRLGGWIRSERQEGVLLEWGPNTLMANEDWFEVFRDLSMLPQKPRVESQRRFIATRAGITELPSGPFSFLMSSILSMKSKMTIFRDLIRSDRLTDEDLTIEDFALRYLNREILDQVLQPFVSGVYAGDAKNLSLRACFPKVWKGLRTKGSIIRGMLSQKSSGGRPQMISFKEGLEQIVHGIAHELGARVHLQSPVEGLRRGASQNWIVQTRFGGEDFDEVILALPSSESARLCRDYLSENDRRFLESIPYQRIMVWNLICEREKGFKRGFGCLFPRTLNTPILGSLWRSEIFEASGPSDRVGLSQFFSGSAIPSNPEDYEAELRQWIPGLGRKLYSQWKTYERGIPQLMMGHSEKISGLISRLPPGISLVGNFVEGVGLLAIIQNVKSTVRQISKKAI